MYGTYMRARIEIKQEALDEQQQALSTSGNGFGGEPGMKVIASDYFSRKLFWMDNKHLIFYTVYNANAPKDIRRNYIWNVIDNKVKPIAIDGSVICFNQGKLYHTTFSDTEVLPDGKKKVERFESTLRELNDKWVVENSRDVEDVWPAPSDHYRQIFGSACKPWFELKPEFRAEFDEPKFRFKYLREWGWIMIFPRTDLVPFNQAVLGKKSGFFDIGNDFYYGQEGIKVADLPNIEAKRIKEIDITYLTYLDVYLLTLPIHNSKEKPYLAILDHDGILTNVEWDQDWNGYNAHPVLSVKGLVWSGRDYRLTNPRIEKNGSFIKIPGDRVYKYLHGSGFDLALSPDGCHVAQSNRPKTTTGRTNLVVFDICRSTYGEMQ